MIRVVAYLGYGAHSRRRLDWEFGRTFSFYSHYPHAIDASHGLM